MFYALIRNLDRLIAAARVRWHRKKRAAYARQRRVNSLGLRKSNQAEFDSRYDEPQHVSELRWVAEHHAHQADMERLSSEVQVAKDKLRIKMEKRLNGITDRQIQEYLKEYDKPTEPERKPSGHGQQEGGN